MPNDSERSNKIGKKHCYWVWQLGCHLWELTDSFCAMAEAQAG